MKRRPGNKHNHNYSKHKLHLRVAAYCRVSFDSADQLYSYAAQINTYTQSIQQYADWELVDIFAEEGLTGTRMDKRPEFNRLLSNCREGRVDKTLERFISRFARNTKDCLVVLRELTFLNISPFISIMSVWVLHTIMLM